MAVAEASFKTLILSISAGFKKFNGFLTALPPCPVSPPGAVFSPDNGTPSTTNKGLLLARTELEPLMFTEIPAPGSPLVCCMLTPAVFPCINCSGEAITPPLKSFALTEVTEPVASLIVVVP